jgi:hypothetical protein
MSIDQREAVLGRRMGGSLGRKPRLREETVVCGTKGCSTVLSRYNLGSDCRVHAVPRYPRLRGELVGDGS